jgi:hypothetical protein
MNISFEHLLWLLLFAAISVYQIIAAKLRARTEPDPEWSDQPEPPQELEPDFSPFEREAPAARAPAHPPARAEAPRARSAAPAHAADRQPLPARRAPSPAAPWRRDLSLRSSVQFKRAFAWTVILGPPRSFRLRSPRSGTIS